MAILIIMNVFTLGERARIYRCSFSGKETAFRLVYPRNIDAGTGFVDVWRADVRNMGLRGKDNALRPLDTLMVVSGMPAALGQCGLVCDCPEPAVPVTTLCVIRANDIDPVWLFYRLRSMREACAGLAEAGRSTAFIPLEGLRALPVPMPSPGQVERVNAIWKRIRDADAERRRLGEEIFAGNAEIGGIMGPG